MPKLILTKKAGRRPTTLFIYKRIHQDLKFLGPEVVPTYMLGRRIFRIREIKWWLQFTSVQFSHPVMSNSLWPHELQHTRFSCPSLTPGVCSNTSPSSQWCLPTIFCCFLLLLPSIIPSIRVFSNESVFHIRWPKYCL